MMTLEDLVGALGAELVRIEGVLNQLRSLTHREGIESSETNQPTNAAWSREETKQLYTIHRDYLIREGELIDSRLTWFLATQAFLFTAYGFSVQKLVEIVSSRSHPPGWKLLHYLTWWGFPVVGFVISLQVALSIWGAFMASKMVKDSWSKLQRKDAKTLDEWIDHVPDIHGAGNPRAWRLGDIMPKALPVTFLLIWLGLSLLYTNWQNNGFP